MGNDVAADYVVIGSGIAGLTLGLLASRHGRVALVTKGNVRDCNSSLAQGGIAAALSADDSASLHGEDTLRTGQGLCHAGTVDTYVRLAPDAVRFLQEVGVAWDCDRDGNLLLGREGAHSRKRIVHAGGDATGRAIVKTLAGQLYANPNISLWENTAVVKLAVEDGECTGAVGQDSSGQLIRFRAKAVVLATGGLGQLYKYTTNTGGSTGDGYALAYRAGALLRDMEFVQFHPTALKCGTTPLPLVSEAVRGEGAILVNSRKEAFMRRYHEWGELASRDIVSRAIYAEMQAGRDVYLDARPISGFAKRFPTVWASCQRIGIDPAVDLIPVVPAAHYTMGGIQTDDRGQASVPRLFAIGEAASSGFHGANRLASNSLLEGLVMAFRTAEALAELPPPGRCSWTDAALLADDARAQPLHASPELLRQVQDVMWTHAGIVRDERQLQHARALLQSWLGQSALRPGADQNLLTAALLVVQPAIWRKESRGAHYRLDYPGTDPEYDTHSIQGGSYESIARTPAASAGAH
ncbi:L-aspartate oxidase [Brevibacillus massiliensis]|uniref:L-aspartate oxidase n=1 Tax=Brevibacillus massiliensis TaxID=1118054 RepID=UPI0002E9BE5B|nr:L-aspartate oxidase [Brevibacillus massiliensis]